MSARGVDVKPLVHLLVSGWAAMAGEQPFHAAVLDLVHSLPLGEPAPPPTLLDIKGRSREEVERSGEGGEGL